MVTPTPHDWKPRLLDPQDGEGVLGRKGLGAGGQKQDTPAAKTLHQKYTSKGVGTPSSPPILPVPWALPARGGECALTQTPPFLFRQASRGGVTRA